jgi:phosphate transport system substrate-binding protein
MADRTGLCTNVGNCPKADRGEKIQLPVGAQFICPECNRELAEARRSGGGSRSAAVTIAIAALVIAGALVFVVRRYLHHSVPGAAIASSPSNATVLLRLHGSNTIGEKLAPALAEKFLAAQGFQNIRRVPGSDPVEMTVEGTAPGDSTPRAIEIKAHGSATAFESLEKGLADIGMASRRISSDESARLSAMGDMTSAANEHVLALDGIAVVVSPANPVDAMTVDQVRRIFSGGIADWSAVGGAAGPISVYARDDNSGTYSTFKDLVLHREKLASTAKRYENSERLSDDLASDRNGIGFVGLPFVRNAKALKLSEGGSVPMLPTRFTVRTEDYILSRRLYLYTSAAPKNPVVRKFVEFATSDAGQQVADGEKFIGQASPEPMPAATPAEPSSEYGRYAAGARRLDVNFRFRTGKTTLDNKAIFDLGRLVEKMDHELKGHELLLFGFADSLGSPDSNLRLSHERATTVRQELIGRGISPAFVKGLGHLYPVASNDTDEGREKNRRVEIWLR